MLNFRVLTSALIVVLTLVGVDVYLFAHDLYQNRGENLEHNAKVDLIAVLTGGQGRLKEAVGYLTQGRGDYLLISGSEPGISLDEILGANKIEGLEDSLRSRILLDEASTSTQENAIQIRRAVKELNAQSLLVVTSFYHMKRAIELIERELTLEPELTVQIYEAPVESPNFMPEDWWRHLTGWHILLSEYLKTRLGTLT